jgi:hypothetical protein
MGIRIPGAAVSAVAGAVEREASVALRAVQQSWSAAPKRAPVRSATPVKDVSIPLLIGGAGLTYLMSPNEPSAPSTAPPDENADTRRVPMQGQGEAFLPLPASLDRKQQQPKPTAPTFWDEVRSAWAALDNKPKPKNYFDQYDNEAEHWSGKPEDLPATFDERFSGAQ